MATHGRGFQEKDVGILGIEEHMGDSRNLYVIGIEKMYVSL